MAKLNRLTLRGYKAIKDAAVEFHSMNVLIGANGAGKSALISFFRLLNEMIGHRLQQFIAQNGRAHSLLYHGPKRTNQIEAILDFETDTGTSVYTARWFYAAGDTLIFADESIQFERLAAANAPNTTSLGAGHAETKVRDAAASGDAIAKVLRHLLNGCRVYHFHDTSPTARLHEANVVGNHSPLMYDCANLASFLYALKTQKDDSAYRRIVSTIQLIAPFFEDFDLRPEGPGGRELFLNWREIGSDQVFGSHQLSDGTLRAICLIALLLQPQDNLPLLIVVDEPELGLHPYALNIFASLLQKAASHTQVLVSTQSSAFLDYFEPEDVIVVDRTTDGATFTRLDPVKLAAWLEDYSLGEVWEKNIVAGGPH